MRPATLLPALAFGFLLMGGAGAGILLLAGLRVYGLAAGQGAPASWAAACAIGLGIAVGALQADRRNAGRGRPLGTSGVALILFCLAAMVTGLVFRLAAGAYALVAPALGGSEVGLWILRLVLAILLLAAPAALWCVALVAFGRGLTARPPDSLALNSGFSLGLMLAGLAIGLVAAPAAIFDLGLRGSLLMAVGIAGIGGAGLIALSLRGLEGEGAVGRLVGEDVPPGPAAGAAAVPPVSITEAAAAALFGFTVWGYVVVWDRTIGLIAGGALPAGAVAAGVLAAGAAVGAILAAGLMERIRNATAALIALIVGGAVAAALSMYLVPRIALVYLNLTPLLERSWLGWIPPAAATVALTTSAAILIGAAIVPWTMTLATPTSAFGRLVPLLVTGAVVAQGTVALGIIPQYGLRRALSLTAAVGLFCAILLVGSLRAAAPAIRQTFTLLLLGLMVVVGGFAATWDPRVVAAGLYRYGARSLQRFGTSEGYLAARRSVLPVFYQEGREATVVVERSDQLAFGQLGGEGLALTVDGRVEATTGTDLRTQVLQGHVPVLVHGPTEEVLLVDYLNGVTAGAVLRHPVSRLTVIERERAVVAGGEAFAPFNDLPQDDPRFRLITDTARARLLADRQEYDVIILAASEPWLAHGSALVTREGFGLVKSRLREGGIVAQRVQITGLPDEACRALLRAFAATFENVLAMQISPEDLLLLGSSGPIGLDVGWIRNVLGSQEAVLEDLRRALVPTANEILNLFRLDREALRTLAGEGPVHDDDRALAEALAVRNLRIHDNAALLEGLEKGREPVVPWLRNYGADPREQADFLYGLAKSYLGLAGDTAGARAVAAELRRLDVPVKARWVQGEINLQEGSIDGALEEWNGVLAIDPGNLDALFSLGTWHLDGRDFWRAEPFLAKAARLHPDTAAVRYHYGRTLFALGRNREAIDELRQVERLAGSREQYPLVEYLVGLASHKLKREAEAAESLQAYLDWAYTQSLTLIEVDAHQKLAEVYDALDRRLEAHKERQKGEDLRRRLAAAAAAQPPKPDAPPAGPEGTPAAPTGPGGSPAPALPPATPGPADPPPGR
jgi:spermidine synthase/tetratricopeptide (TPR) repeat protein